MTGDTEWLEQARAAHRSGGASDRIILLFEIWRPDIDMDEREQLTRIFSAIDSYGEQ